MKQLIFSFKDKSIKAALVEKSGDSFNVSGGGSVGLEPGNIEGGVVRNYDLVKEKLQSLIGGLEQARSFHILVLLSEEAGFLKVLAGEKEKDLLEKPEVQENVPYPIKGSFTTLRLLRNKNIQLVATPREVVSTYQKLFKELGLEIASIIPEPAIFLPFLQKREKPVLVVSSEGDSIIFVTIFESGIYFSTTKHFDEGSFNQGRLTEWVKEVVEQNIKTLTPTLDFEVLVFGEHEEEILNALKESNFLASVLTVRFGTPPKLDDPSSYKKLIIAAGLDKQIPGFHIKDVRESAGGRIIKAPILPRFNWPLMAAGFAILIILAGLIWAAPRVINTLFPTEPQEKVTTPAPPVATPSASPSATPSAKKEEPKEATKAAEKKEEPKPVLKRSDLKIEVLNGNGVAGAASEAEEFLEGKGYKVTSVGNASNFNFAKTEIRLKKSKEDYLPLLTKDLGSKYTVIKGASLAESNSADAQVIIGKK